MERLVVSCCNYQVVPHGWHSRRKDKRDSETKATNLNKINNWDMTIPWKEWSYTTVVDYVANAFKELKEEMKQIKEMQGKILAFAQYHAR